MKSAKSSRHPEGLSFTDLLESREVLQMHMLPRLSVKDLLSLSCASRLCMQLTHTAPDITWSAAAAAYLPPTHAVLQPKRQAAMSAVAQYSASSQGIRAGTALKVVYDAEALGFFLSPDGETLAVVTGLKPPQQPALKV